jgi:hypothetical protein
MDPTTAPTDVPPPDDVLTRERSALVLTVVPVPVILVLLAVLVSSIPHPPIPDVGPVGEIVVAGLIDPAKVGLIVPVKVLVIVWPEANDKPVKVLLYTVAEPDPEVEAVPSDPDVVVAAIPLNCAELYVKAIDAVVTVEGPLLVVTTVNTRLLPAIAVDGEVDTIDRSAL